MIVGAELDSIQHIWWTKPAVQQFLPKAQGTLGQETQLPDADCCKTGAMKFGCSFVIAEVQPQRLLSHVSYAGSW